MRFIYATAAVCMAIAFTNTPARSQNASQIIQQALQVYEDGAQQTDNYRMTTETMGFETETLMKKEIIDGHAAFVPAQFSGSADSQWESPQNWFRQITNRAKYDGTEEVDGRRCHLISIDNFEGIDVGPGIQSDGDFEPTWMSLALDTESSLPRRMRMKGNVVVEGSTRPVSMEVLMTDYRQVNGMYHPFRMLIEADGFMGPGGTSEEDMAEAQESLEELERSLEDMSDQERAMVERMMGPQLERLREMIDSGKLKVEMVVKSIEPNVAE
jgi:hypothetical protein